MDKPTQSLAIDKSTQRSVIEAVDLYIRVRYARIYEVDEEAELPMFGKAAAVTFDEEITKARDAIALLGRGEMEAYRHVLAEMKLELGDNRRTVTATCKESYTVEYATEDSAEEDAEDAAAEKVPDRSIGMRRHCFTVDLTIDGPMIMAHEEQEVSAEELAAELALQQELAEAAAARAANAPRKPTTFERFKATPKLQLLRSAFGGATVLNISIIVAGVLVMMAGAVYTFVPTTTVAECSLQTGSVRSTTTLLGMTIATSQKESPNATWARAQVLDGPETWLVLTTTTRNNAGYMRAIPGHPLAAFIRPNLKTLQGLATREPDAAKAAIERYRKLAAEVDPSARTVEGLPDTIYATRPDPQTIRNMPPFAAFSFEKR